MLSFATLVTGTVVLAKGRFMFISFITEFKVITGEVSLGKCLPLFVSSIGI